MAEIKYLSDYDRKMSVPLYDASWMSRGRRILGVEEFEEDYVGQGFCHHQKPTVFLQNLVFCKGKL